MRAVKNIVAARAFGNTAGCPFCLAVAGMGPMQQVGEQFCVHNFSRKPILFGFAS
jgi:hypothetical protein